MGYTKLIFTTIFLAFVILVSAQENDTQEICVQNDSIINSGEICICKCNITPNTTTIALASESDTIISTLQADIVRLQELEKQLRQKNDSLENDLSSLQGEITRLNEKLKFADTVVARVANDCLRKKYDHKRVDEALVNFSRMYSIELQHTFSPLKDLLNNYGAYTQELNELFSTIEHDETLTNPFDWHEKVLTYIDKIMSSNYYKEAYNKSWTIPYLNKVIDDAIKRLEMYNPKDKQSIKLLDLLER